MLKLLQINIVSNLLSTGKITEGIAMVASSKAWQCYIAFGRDSKHGICKEIRVGSMFDECVHYAKHVLFDKDGLSSENATRQLIRKIEEIKPDIIHLHNIHDHYLNYKVLFEYLNSVRTHVVWTLHDCWNFTGGCCYFDSVDCFQWKNECKKCVYKKSSLFDRSNFHFKLKRKLFLTKRELTLVPVSNWLAHHVKSSFLRDKDIRVFHNGVDIRVFKPYDGSSIRQKYKLNDKFVIIGVASPWSKRKGLNDFIKLDSFLDDSFQIILVGLNEKQLKKIPNSIIGIKRTSDVNSLSQLYSAADVYVNLTYSDNFPTTNIESLACGTPVVTYRTGGSPEAIDSETGVVVEQGDVESVLKTILTMRKKPLSSVKCRERAVKYFDKNKCFENYINLYMEVLRR